MLLKIEIESLKIKAVDLLKKLIAAPSFSKEENETAIFLQQFFKENNIVSRRILNNVFVFNRHFNPSLPTILLNSHHDTVKPNSGYTKDPFEAFEEGDKIYGLGSNDAGGSLVALIAVFLFYYEKSNLKYNLCLAATAEEETSGKAGMEFWLNEVRSFYNFGTHPDDCAIIGEPTQMQMAVAEKGLLVLDCVAKGEAGHAARDKGQNAIYAAIKDIDWIRNYQFEKISSLLGPVKMTVTGIYTENKAHNVIPDSCNFLVDIRVNELYSLEEVLDIIQKNLTAEVSPRSLRIKSTIISLDHALVKSGISIGRKYFGSPTTSDKALVGIPAIKMGPGDSGRSHTADEFIYKSEISEAVDIYINLLNKMVINDQL